MNEEKAREILAGSIEPDNSISNLGKYMEWLQGDDGVRLDGRFSADELEAIVWWMRNKGAK